MGFSTSEQKILTLLWNKKMSEASYEEIQGYTTIELSEKLAMARSNVSTILNRLVREHKIKKTTSRPVIYYVEKMYEPVKNDDQLFENLVGADGSLARPIKLAKAAVLYPPNGLHTLLLGPTGVGKSMFAKLMYKFSIESAMMPKGTPFVTLNCADYANNPQLLLSTLFGHKKGAFTGADEDKAGLVDKANGGFLFLDEVHRLPPEGQELFFYLIDQKEYVPLGSTQKKTANIRLICATTETIESSLLQTFTRRIPMIISLPEIEKRSLNEKYELLSIFFKDEAKRIGKSVRVSEEALYCLLSYQCRGNVGQMKSDIRQICASAFLDSVYQNQLNEVTVEIDHLPLQVRKAILTSAFSRGELSNYANGEHIFTSIGKLLTANDMEINEENYYKILEERLLILKNSNLEEEEIKELIGNEIEKQFSSYVELFSDYRPELSKTVDQSIITLVENFLLYCSEKFGEIYEKNVFYGLCFHLQNSIKNGSKIDTIEEQLSIVQSTNKEIYLVVKEYFDKNHPKLFDENELSFITMFLVTNHLKNQKIQSNVNVLIVMHGDSTASSMANVVNELLGIDSVLAYDLALSMDQKIAYQELKKMIREKCLSKEVLMFTDMGSLSLFGELIGQELNKNIRVVDMITTALAIELTRKSLQVVAISQMEPMIEESYSSFLEYFRDKNLATLENYERIIISLCMTGQGGAIQIKNVIEDEIDLKQFNTAVIPLAMSNHDDLIKEIRSITTTKRVIAIVGTFNPEIVGIPFFSFSDLLGENSLKILVEGEKGEKKQSWFDHQQYKAVLRNLMDESEVEDVIKLFIIFFEHVNRRLAIRADHDQAVGITLHVLSLIDDLKQSRTRNEIKEIENTEKMYEKEIESISNSLIPLENYFKVSIPSDEISLLAKILLEE